jgi:hypothetical protein
MRAFATSLLEVTGVALVAVGAFIVSPALGAIVTGTALVGAGYLLGGDR